MIFSKQLQSISGRVSRMRFVSVGRESRGASFLFTSLALGACVCLSGCEGLGSANMATATVPTHAAGTTVPNGSPEYQALAKEACELMNNSRATMKSVVGMRSTSANVSNSVMHLTYQMRGYNARFVTPSLVACETQTKTTSVDKENPGNPWSNMEVNSVKSNQFDLKSITHVTVSDMGENGNLAQNNSDLAKTAVVSSTCWSVEVAGSGIASSRSDGNSTPVAVNDFSIAYFDSKAEAQRLATVLKKLSALAKAN